MSRSQMLAVVAVTAGSMIAGSLSGCSKKSDGAAGGPAKTGPVVARVGSETITADEVKQRLSEQSPFLQARYKDLAHRKEFVNNLVRSEILAQEAHKRGLDRSPEVRNTIKKILVQELIRREFDEKQASFSEQELKAYYDRHVDEFVRPERVRAQHVFLTAAASDKAARAKARAKAAELLKKLQDNEAKAPVNHPKHADYSTTLFADLARDNSDDQATKTIGGDLRYLSQEDMAKQYGAEFAAAVFALKNPNDLSGIVETPNGYHIARLTNRQLAVNRAFEDAQVKETIKGRLFREQRTKSFDEYVEKLKKEANVSIDEQVLAGIELPGATPTAPGHGPVPPMPMPGTVPAGAKTPANPR